VFAVAGIKDIIAKQRGSNNKVTNARVTMKALAMLKKTARTAPKVSVATSEGDTTVVPASPKVKKAA